MGNFATIKGNFSSLSSSKKFIHLFQQALNLLNCQFALDLFSFTLDLMILSTLLVKKIFFHFNFQTIFLKFFY